MVWERNGQRWLRVPMQRWGSMSSVDVGRVPAGGKGQVVRQMRKEQMELSPWVG